MGLPVRHRKARVGIGDCRGGEGVRGKKKNTTHKGEWGCPRITGEPGMGLGAVVGGGLRAPQPHPMEGKGRAASAGRQGAAARRRWVSRALIGLWKCSAGSIRFLFQGCETTAKKKSSEGRYLNIIKEREGEREPASVGLVLTCCRPAAGVNHSQPPSCISGCFSL